MIVNKAYPEAFVTVILLLCNAFHCGQSWVQTGNEVSKRCRPSGLLNQVSRNLPNNANLRATSVDIPRLSSESLQQLKDKNFIVIPQFLSNSLTTQLRNDVATLRERNKFAIAKIGQDSTNQLDASIRVAETCFLGKNALQDSPSTSRDALYTILDHVRSDIAAHTDKPLDGMLSELLYAYYPEGGFYRRHRDAVPKSASVLRSYSLLLYLNSQNWTKADGGELRMHFDSGGDFLPDGEMPNYIDINPTSGTLVLFKSDAIPHEVLDTQKERVAIVGWYNRPVTVNDISELTPNGGLDPMRVTLLAVGAGLITVGLISITSIG